MNTISNLSTNQIYPGALSRVPGLMIFKINNYEFCIDHQFIKAVINFTDASIVSKSRVTSGIISGKTEYTLVNIHGFLEFPNVEYGLDSRLILIDTFGKKFGFIADKIIELIPSTELFKDNNLEFVIPQDKKQRFSGVLKFKNRRILMLNLSKITQAFDKVIEFPRRIKTAEYVDEEIKDKLKQVMHIS